MTVERTVTSLPLTRSFRETVREHARHEPAFRAALMEEADRALLDGDAGLADRLRDDALAFEPAPACPAGSREDK